MYRDASVGVVVPAFNEGPFIGTVLDTMPEFVDRVYAVDDCSTDETWAEIESRVTPELIAEPIPDGGSSNPSNVVPIRHRTNRGRGAAVKTGYQRAMEDDLDIVVVMDGDAQMDPNQLDRLLDPVVSGRADYAKGNRLARPRDWRGMSNWRLFGNVMLTLLTNVASGYWGLRDSQNGYTAISAEMLEQLDIEALYDDYGFLNDMLVTLNMHHARVYDVEMPAVYGDERSGIRYGTFIPSLSLLLFRGFLRRLKHEHLEQPFHPAVVLYTIGMTGLILSGLSLISRLPRRLRSTAIIRIGCAGAVALVLGIVIDRRENGDRLDREGSDDRS
jgi:glycosyltransferase involved in cell wall biosynthesis